MIKLGRGQFRIREMKVPQNHEEGNNKFLNPELYSQDFNKQCEDDTPYLKHHIVPEMYL